MKVFIPIILVLFLLQSCESSNNDPEEANDLIDVNPVVEEADLDGDPDDERVLDNENADADAEDDVDGGLDLWD